MKSTNKSRNEESQDYSHICNKRISEPSDDEDQEEENDNFNLGLGELTGEIKKMQLQDQANELFDDVEELFETYSRKDNTQYAKVRNGNEVLGGKGQVHFKQPTFTDMSIIQSTNSEFNKIRKK